MQNTITIDMNKPCRRCGKKGATNGGLCLRCVTKAMEAGEFDHILKPIKPAPADGLTREQYQARYDKILDEVQAKRRNRRGEPRTP